MAHFNYSLHSRNQLDDAQIKESAQLFSEHYGVWGEGGYGKVGTRVKFTPSRFKTSLLFDESCFVLRAVDPSSAILIGHAVARVFHYSELDGKALWITQLVVHQDYRNRGVAKRLLTDIIHGLTKNHEILAAGIASSHPYTIRAFQRATNVTDVVSNLPFMAQHGQGLIDASGVPYLQPSNNVAYAATFKPDSPTKIVSIVKSNFFVAHEEPKKALKTLEGTWELGELESGSEFLLVAPISASLVLE